MTAQTFPCLPSTDGPDQFRHITFESTDLGFVE